MRKVLGFVDSVSQWTGKIVQWLCVVLIVVLSYEVTMRYVFNAPTIWVMQTSMMLGGAIVTLGWCFVQQQKAHVRVDLFYGRYSERGKALTNILGSLVFFFPFIGILTYRSFTQFLYSVAMHEKMPETAWYPPVYPIKLVIFVGFLLFLLQGTVQFIREVQVLTKGRSDA